MVGFNFILAISALQVSGPETVWAWKDGKPLARLVSPRLEESLEGIVERTLNGYLKGAYGFSLPLAEGAERPGLYLVFGDQKNSKILSDLSRQGLDLDLTGLGSEGFRILTHESGRRRFVIVTARTAVGLKYGAQELAYFHLPATKDSLAVDWPIDLRRKPALDYRGVYLLPCWAAHDSLESWKRVLRFHSELTINRNWFWLAGFPILPEYGGEYSGTDLSDRKKVTELVELCRREGMKFFIGGGWFTWHHAKHAGGSIERGVQYYLDLLSALPGAEGIYLEPSGEGREVDDAAWRKRTEAFSQLARRIWKERPDFEFAIAIGQFNSKAYREALHRIDGRRIFWWWCWGDPLRDNALTEHPLVLRWHTIRRMSHFHGSTEPPGPEEARLTGLATSYDPGMGFGNPWNGWPAMGVDFPRDFHPHTIPFFSHQYWFRERSWDLRITRKQFAARLSRRLFDADMPGVAVEHYLQLAEWCFNPEKASGDVLVPLESFVRAHAGQGTPRNRDTLSRMQEAIDGFRKVQK